MQRFYILAIACLVGWLSVMSAEIAPAQVIGFWRFDQSDSSDGAAIAAAESLFNAAQLSAAGSNGAVFTTDVPGIATYDPLTGTLYENNYAMDSSASQAKITVPNDPLLNPSVPNESFTMEFFIKLTGEPGSYQNFVARVDNGPGGDSNSSSDRHGWQVDFDHGGGSGSFGKIRSRWDTPGTPPPDYNNVSTNSGSDRLYVDTDGGTGNIGDYTGGDVANQGDGVNDVSEWQHVAVVYDASAGNQDGQFRIYLDYQPGSLKDLTGPFVHPDAALTIGKHAGVYGLLIDEARYTAGALAPDQFLRVAAPEPSSAILGLLGLGLVGLLAPRKRSR